MQEQDSIPAGAILDNWSKTRGKMECRLTAWRIWRSWSSRRGTASTRSLLLMAEAVKSGSRGQFFPELTPARLAGATLEAASVKCAGFTPASDGDQRQWPADRDHSRRIHPHSHLTLKASFRLRYISDKCQFAEVQPRIGCARTRASPTSCAA